MEKKEIKTECPTCRFELRIKDLLIYKNFRCPHCGMRYEIRPIPIEPQPDRTEEGKDRAVDLVGMFVNLWEQRKSTPFHVWPEDVIADFKTLKNDITAIIDRRIEEIKSWYVNNWPTQEYHVGMIAGLWWIRRRIVGEKKNENL